MAPGKLLDRSAWLPAALVAGLLLAAWATARLLAAWHFAAPQPQMVLVGWLMLVILVPAFASIALSAAESTPARRWLRFAWLTDAVGLALLVVAADSLWLQFWEAVRLYLLLATWLAFWTAAAGLLRRLGVGLAVGGGTTLMAAVLAAPVLVMPLLRALPVGARPQGLAVTVHLCPVFAALDVMRDSVLFVWHQTPVMYHLTAVGQDVPLELPAWWTSLLIYAAGAAVLGAADLLLPPSRN